MSIDDDGYTKAMLLKKSGDFEGAARILIQACITPHIAHGWYRELFVILRQFNRQDLKNARYQKVMNRVLDMIRYDDEMVKEMLNYWSIQQRRKLPPNYFDNDRNFKISDAKALLEAARAIGDRLNIDKAEELIKKYKIKGDSVTALDKPLAKQCEEINVHLIELNIPKAKTPELSAYTYYINNGYVGAHCEGGAILTVIKALTLDTLKKYNQLGEEDSITRFLEAQFELIKNPTDDNKKISNPKNAQDEIFNSIRTISKYDFLNNYREIVNNQTIQSYYPGLTIEFAASFIDTVKRTEIESIARQIMHSPYNYRAGWPDLTLVKNNEVKFVEVKTSDKLHASQLRTITDMRKLINAEFIVAKISYQV